MLKNLIFVILLLPVFCLAQVKPDFIRTPNSNNTIVDWNLKAKTFIAPHGATLGLNGSQDTTGNVFFHVGGGDTSLNIRIGGVKWWSINRNTPNARMDSLNAAIYSQPHIFNGNETFNGNLTLNSSQIAMPSGASEGAVYYYHAGLLTPSSGVFINAGTLMIGSNVPPPPGASLNLGNALGGILMPQLSQTSRLALNLAPGGFGANVLYGVQVYQTDNTVGQYVNLNGTWQRFLTTADSFSPSGGGTLTYSLTNGYGIAGSPFNNTANVTWSTDTTLVKSKAGALIDYNNLSARITSNNTAIGLRKLISDSTASTGYQTVGNFFPKGDTRYFTQSISDGRYLKVSDIRNAANFGLTASLADVAHYANPNTGDQTYRVGGWINLLSVSGGDAVVLQVSWTDNHSVSKTKTFIPQGLTSGSLTAVDDYAFPTMDFRVLTGTTVQVSTVVSGAGSITYEVGATIQKIQGN